MNDTINRYQLLFENMLNGLAYCKMIFDEKENPVDFIYLEVNNAFGKLTGLKDVVGKRVTEVIPGIKESNSEIFAIYGRVAQTGKPEQFETEIKQLSIYLFISVYSPEKGYFTAVFEDITKRKVAEEALRAKVEEAKKFNELTVNRELKMAELKKELEERKGKTG